LVSDCSPYMRSITDFSQNPVLDPNPSDTQRLSGAGAKGDGSKSPRWSVGYLRDGSAGLVAVSAAYVKHLSPPVFRWQQVANRDICHPMKGVFKTRNLQVRLLDIRIRQSLLYLLPILGRGRLPRPTASDIPNHLRHCLVAPPVRYAGA
jgi:hypothetical protein